MLRALCISASKSKGDSLLMPGVSDTHARWQAQHWHCNALDVLHAPAQTLLLHFKAYLHPPNSQTDPHQSPLPSKSTYPDRVGDHQAEPNRRQCQRQPALDGER